MDDMSLTTHCAGYDILNEFFARSVIGPRPVNNIEGPGKWPAFTAESTHRSEALEHTVLSKTPDALNAPRHSSNTSIDGVSSGASDILDPDLPIASATTSESGSSGSSKPESSSLDPTIYTPSETHIHSDWPSGVRHTTYVKRSILDDPAPWLELVLTAPEMDDTSHRPNSVPGVLDDILTKGDVTLCVKIITSIMENQVKYHCYISKPAFKAAQERSREVEGNKIGLHVRRLTSGYVLITHNLLVSSLYTPVTLSHTTDSDVL